MARSTFFSIKYVFCGVESTNIYQGGLLSFMEVYNDETRKFLICNQGNTGWLLASVNMTLMPVCECQSEFLYRQSSCLHTALRSNPSMSAKIFVELGYILYTVSLANYHFYLFIIFLDINFMQNE